VELKPEILAKDSVPSPKIEEESKVVEADKVEESDEASDNLVENQVVHTKSISIKGVLKGASREIPVADEEISEDDVVAELEKDLEKEVEIKESDLQKAWQDFATSIEKDHPRIYSTMKQYGPTMKSSGKIKIELGSNAQRENFINNIKPMLTKYLQTHLANIEYDFEAGLIANGEVGKKVYTDNDKLDYMIKKNADLENLKNTFNLDFDN
jgi:DNA polymerase III alpha subunit (gram-positive type)